jgi:hypothetical protein
LKCIYWDRQADSIPDLQVELTSRLHEIAHFIKSSDSKKSKSGSKRKREYHQLIERTVAEPSLYSLCFFRTWAIRYSFISRGNCKTGPLLGPNSKNEPPFQTLQDWTAFLNPKQPLAPLFYICQFRPCFLNKKIKKKRE